MKKPTIKLSGQDGNVFNLIGIASKALKSEGLRDEASKMTSKCFNAGSYDEAIQVIMEYCEVE